LIQKLKTIALKATCTTNRNKSGCCTQNKANDPTLVVVNVDWSSFTSGIVVDDVTDELGEGGVEEDVLTIVVTLNKIIDKIGGWVWA
jgi:hypothetical protein